jgi:hypothetical protein
MTSTDGSDTDTTQSSQNDTPSKVKLMIHHQFPGIELVSPIYACPTCLQVAIGTGIERRWHRYGAVYSLPGMV